MSTITASSNSATVRGRNYGTGEVQYEVLRGGQWQPVTRAHVRKLERTGKVILWNPTNS